jgi:hypothetical protein
MNNGCPQLLDFQNLKYVWSTSDGQQFDGPTAVAKHVGVSVEEVCDRASAALQRDMSIFVCNGVTIKRQQIVQECETSGDVSTELNVEYLLTLEL